LRNSSPRRYSIVDEIKIVSGDDETVYILEQTDDHTLLELSDDLARALQWSEGDKLSFNVTDDNTLELSKK
jgi:hypothetical protein